MGGYNFLGGEKGRLGSLWSFLKLLLLLLLGFKEGMGVAFVDRGITLLIILFSGGLEIFDSQSFG